MLTSLRFWGVVGFITEIVQFVLHNKSLENIGQILGQFVVNFPYLKAFHMWVTGVHSDVIECSIYCGEDMLLKYLHVSGMELTPKHLRSAIHHDTFPCVQYLVEHGCVCDTNIFNSACIKGHLRCFKYIMSEHTAHNARENSPVRWRVPISDDNIDCFIAFKAADPNPTYYSNITEAMIYNGIDSIRYGHEKGLPLHHDQYVSTIVCANFEAFKCLHDLGCPWDLVVANTAAINGQLAFLKYAHEHGCPWEADGLCYYAACGGNLDCLKYAREQGCPWDARVTNVAARYKHDACLQYARENGCPEHSVPKKRKSQCVCS